MRGYRTLKSSQAASVTVRVNPSRLVMRLNNLRALVSSVAVIVGPFPFVDSSARSITVDPPKRVSSLDFNEFVHLVHVPNEDLTCRKCSDHYYTSD